MNFRLYDAHNHLQDERLAPHREAILAVLQKEGVAGMVVNGSCEEDWPEVLALARQHTQVIPSFGYHPWYVKERSAEWQQALLRHLEAVPSSVGEVGLDRWMKDYDLESSKRCSCGNCAWRQSGTCQSAFIVCRLGGCCSTSCAPSPPKLWFPAALIRRGAGAGCTAG